MRTSNPWLTSEWGVSWGYDHCARSVVPRNEENSRLARHCERPDRARGNLSPRRAHPDAPIFAATHTLFGASRCALRVLTLCIVVIAATSCARGRRPSDPSCYVPNIWPTTHPQAHVSSEFGYRNDPFTGERRFHKGIDIAAPMKSPVVATAYGRVVDRDKNRRGYGRFVLIDHGNGYETFYAHLSDFKTKKGKWVKRGQVIGKVGQSGRATGPHLQYEVRHDGKPINPRPFLP